MELGTGVPKKKDESITPLFIGESVDLIYHPPLVNMHTIHV
jgi:hypothetical protein